MLRPPQPSDQDTKAAVTDNRISVPLGIDLGTLSVDDLHVGAELGGVDSHWKVSGAGLVTADGTPSRVKLDMTRTDGPAAHLSADLGFSLDRFSVDGQITAEESTRGGVVAALIGRPDLDRMSLKLIAKGDRAEARPTSLPRPATPLPQTAACAGIATARRPRSRCN